MAKTKRKRGEPYEYKKADGSTRWRIEFRDQHGRKVREHGFCSMTEAKDALRGHG